MSLPTAPIRWGPRRRGWLRKSGRSCAARPPATLRLNKYISETGVCSRREADKWIEAGRVTCNGRVAALGTRVVDGDEICVDGAPLGAKKKQIYIALNKPVGVTCTTEAHIEDKIIDLVGYPERIFPFGRLDNESV